ncbi:MAG: DUF6348 family protein [Polyangiaceae bacterium]
MSVTADIDASLLSTKGSAMLASTFRALGLHAVEQDSAVSVANRSISVVARIDNRAQKDTRSILAATFEVLIDGRRIPTLTGGAIGVGETPVQARDTAAADWAFQYGAPIGFALATTLGAEGRPTATDPLARLYGKTEVDGQGLFYGPPGIRGRTAAPDEVASIAFLRTVATSVVRLLRCKSPACEYRSTTILILVEGSAVTGGECRLDGDVSPELLDTLSKLTWPEGAPKYVFKLFFVGSSGNEAAGAR